MDYFNNNVRMKQTMSFQTITQEFDAKMMRLALRLAQLSEKKGEVPIGAVLVNKNGEILAKSTNLRETKCTVLGHAELVVLHKANRLRKSWRLNDCTLYVTLEPCLMCAAALVQSRIHRVVFAAHDPKGGALGSLMNLSCHPKLNHNFQLDQGLYAKESSDLLKNFFQKKRKSKIKKI